MSKSARQKTLRRILKPLLQKALAERNWHDNATINCFEALLHMRNKEREAALRAAMEAELNLMQCWPRGPSSGGNSVFVGRCAAWIGPKQKVGSCLNGNVPNGLRIATTDYG